MKKVLVLASSVIAILAMGTLAGLASLRDQAQGTVIAPEACTRDFHDDFHALDVTSVGPGSRWIAHTPWFGDFGDAAFSDPTPNFPFTTGPDGLTITAMKDETGKWRSGLISSTDPHSNGFAATYGYFEVTAILPKGKGVWPAFWLLTADRKANPDIEVDIFEYYGRWPDRFQSTVTVRPKGNAPSHSYSKWISVEDGTLTADFHRYGVNIGKEDMIFYLDRHEVWRGKTPPEHQKPLGILMNLALGSGWPIKETPSPSRLHIKEVSHYRDTDRCIRSEP